MSIPNFISLARLIAVPFIVYLTLGHKGLIDDLVEILVVFRDLMIVGGVFLLFIFRNHTKVEPILVSKFNTGAQLVLVTVVLAEAGNEFAVPMLDQILSWLVIATTIVSGAWYLVRWGRQMASVEETR